MGAILKPKLLKFGFFWLSIQKQFPFGTPYFMVPFLDKSTLVLALKLFETSLSLQSS